MAFLYVLLLSAGSMAVLFLLTKLMGFRQISEMSFFDYVIGITIGSIAAEMSTNLDLEWWKGVTAMAVYALLGLGLSVLAQKSLRARKLLSGTPILLMQNGKIQKKNLKKAKMELNDLLTAARTNGYFDLADIDCAIMETTGKISFLPKAGKRQLTPQDFNFSPERSGLPQCVILDGKVLEDGLRRAGMRKKELEQRLADRHETAENILLATVDEKKCLTIFHV